MLCTQTPGINEGGKCEWHGHCPPHTPGPRKTLEGDVVEMSTCGPPLPGDSELLTKPVEGIFAEANRKEAMRKYLRYPYPLSRTPCVKSKWAGRDGPPAVGCYPDRPRLGKSSSTEERDQAPRDLVGNPLRNMSPDLPGSRGAVQRSYP